MGKVMPDEIKIINAEFIIDPPNPNRVELDVEQLQALADSIKQIGLQEPIIVRPIQWCALDNKPFIPICGTEHVGHSIEKYEVVAGHRRFRACLLIGKVNIECIVKSLTDDEAEDIKAHENLFRQDLDPLEEAIFLGRLIGNDDTKVAVVAKRLNHSEQWVWERLTLLSFPEYLQIYLRTGKIGIGVAKWLGRIEDDVYRKMYCEMAANNGMSTIQAEYLFRQWDMGLMKDSSTIMPPPEGPTKSTYSLLKARCAKCGNEAVEPNIYSVFIHKDCPVGEAGEGQSINTPPSSPKS